MSAEVIVADNHSSDGSRAYLENRFPQVRFNWLNHNEGFGKANNQMLEQASGEYVLFLNPDTIVPEDCFEKCITYFKEAENAGALGVKMLDGSGCFLKESKRSFPSPQSAFYKLSGLAALFPASRHFAKYYAGHLSPDENNEVEVLAGAFMLISRQVLEKVKGFDEDFFMYGEDIDLSYRVRQCGFKNYYFAGTSIIHFKGESTQRYSAAYNRHFYGAMKLYVKKHYREKKSTLISMLVAVNVSRLLALLFSAFKKVFSANRYSRKKLNTAVIAGQQVFDNMIHLLKYSKETCIIKGRIAVDKKDNGISLGHVQQLPAIIKNSGIEQLLFCEGELDFKEIIRLSSQLGGKVKLLFHAKNSKCIVGSYSQHENGIFISET